MISTLSKKHNFDLVFDSQKVFRLILEAMSNPGKVVFIKEYADKMNGEYPEILAIAMTLLDNEVSFNTCGNDSLSDEIASLTLAKRETIENADFVFVHDLNDMKYSIENAKCGTLSDPHKSAVLIILNENGQTVNDAVSLRDAQNYEYPQGIDMIFVSSNGELFSIPSLTKVVK